MSICESGLSVKPKAESVVITITNAHPLLRLAQGLDWSALADLVRPDLKATGGCWHLGRKLKLRIHLGVFLLQQLYNQVDRQTEYAVRDNAAWQLFCGKGIVDDWHCPDHTKIQTFRSRLSPSTQQQLANAIAQKAVQLGFADPSHVDIDSTVQAANMAYPSDANLLCKLGQLAKRAADYMNE